MKKEYIAPELMIAGMLPCSPCAGSADASSNDVSFEEITVGDEIPFD